VYSLMSAWNDGSAASAAFELLASSIDALVPLLPWQFLDSITRPFVSSLHDMTLVACIDLYPLFG
jgi:hypothetical protein